MRRRFPRRESGARVTAAPLALWPSPAELNAWGFELLGGGVRAGEHHLERDSSVEPKLPGAIDDAHAPAAKLALDLVTGRRKFSDRRGAYRPGRRGVFGGGGGRAALVGNRRGDARGKLALGVGHDRLCWVAQATPLSAAAPRLNPT
jgi:hypothetical protein